MLFCLDELQRGISKGRHLPLHEFISTYESRSVIPMIARDREELERIAHSFFFFLSIRSSNNV